MASDLPKPSWRRTAAFRLADLEVHPESGEVRSRRGTERMRPLLMDVLLRLAANPGEVVRRETLLEEVWPRRMVNDEVLSRAIAELRTALGDDARQARYVETLPKLGYRLVASVEPLERTASSPGPAPAAARPPSGIVRWVGLAVVALVLAVAAVGVRSPVDPHADLERRLAAALPLTSDPALELAPRFSPDGQRVAFVVGEGTQSRILVQSVDGTGRRSLEEPGLLQHSPVFFPDGRRIAYWRGRGGDCAIVERDLETDAVRTLVDCKLSPRARFDLSPDGRRIAFTGTTRAQVPAGLGLAEVDTGATRVLTRPEPGMGDDLYPRFSPDGQRIAYFHGSESHRQAWIAEVKSARQSPASRHEGLSYGAAWLGARGPLLVAADWFGFRALNLVELESGIARLVGARGARFPDVNARGDVVYENATYGANLWRIEVGGAAPARVMWPSTRYTSQPQFSPDGRRVAFASNREGQDSLFVAPLDGEAAKLALPAGYRYIRPRWSANGQRLYAIRIPIGPLKASQAIRIDPERSTHEVLTALGDNVAEARESADGKWLHFGEATGHAMRLMRTPIERLDRAERLPLPLASEFQMNHSALVFAQPQLPGLTRCRHDGGACERLDVPISDANRFDWALGVRSVFYRGGTSLAPTLERFDLERGKPATPLAWPAGASPGPLAVNPAETLVLATREERVAVDLMLARR